MLSPSELPRLVYITQGDSTSCNRTPSRAILSQVVYSTCRSIPIFSCSSHAPRSTNFCRWFPGKLCVIIFRMYVCEFIRKSADKTFTILMHSFKADPGDLNKTPADPSDSQRGAALPDATLSRWMFWI